MSAILVLLAALFLGQGCTRKGEGETRIDLTKIRNPILDPHDYEGIVSFRDPAMFYRDGIFYCFFSTVYLSDGRYKGYIGLSSSSDLAHWEKPRRITPLNNDFWSPGNVIRAGTEWVLCMQTYPIEPWEKNAGESCRLWIARSRDLVHWDEPVSIFPQGSQVRWAKSHRQIDPYLVPFQGKYYCLYKTSSRLGLLESKDLVKWGEASPDKPIVDETETPEKRGLENPCVVQDGDGFVLFFAPSSLLDYKPIGMARSKNLFEWRDFHYADFPRKEWLKSGPNAAMVLDLREKCGFWIMAIHGDRKQEKFRWASSIGLAWSKDLEHWTCP